MGMIHFKLTRYFFEDKGSLTCTEGMDIPKITSFSLISKQFIMSQSKNKIRCNNNLVDLLAV
jgi:hypothetical protein